METNKTTLKTPQIKCANCGEKFEQARSWHKFCSRKCRVENWHKNHPRFSPEEMDEIKRKLKMI